MIHYKLTLLRIIVQHVLKWVKVILDMVYYLEVIQFVVWLFATCYLEKDTTKLPNICRKYKSALDLVWGKVSCCSFNMILLVILGSLELLRYTKVNEF